MNSKGNHIRLSIFGESHGPSIGVVMDGLPAGLEIDDCVIRRDMQRRMPRSIAGSTQRREEDRPEIQSGVKNGFTTGAPLCAIIFNRDAKSSAYSDLADRPRPSHADYTASLAYGGYCQLAGGGHFSGRLTAPLVFAGAICRCLLAQRGIALGSHICEVGGVRDRRFDALHVEKEELKQLREMDFPVLDRAAGEQMSRRIEESRRDLDSVGGVIECAAVGLPVGLGGLMFGGLESEISSMVFGIPGVKGIEFGEGFGFAGLYGSEANDQMCMTEGKAEFLSNHCGGILGGLSSGAPLILRAVFKPTPSIAKPQSTIDQKEGKTVEIQIKGRHDSCIAIRGLAALEAAVAVALADALMDMNGGKTI